MQNNFLRFERPPQWLQVESSQRIDNEVVAATPKAFGAGRGRRTDLKQTKFLPVRMQAVCLNIDGNAIGSLDLLEQLSQPGIGRNKIGL